MVFHNEASHYGAKDSICRYGERFQPDLALFTKQEFNPSMSISPVLLTALGILVQCSAQSFDIAPVYVNPGNAPIMGLFDLHKSLGVTGYCEDLDPVGMEMVWTLMWMDDKLDRNSSSTGLVIYDTCRSVSRALQIVNKLLMSPDCGISPTIGGIISYGLPKIATTLRKFADYSGIFYVELQDDVNGVPANQVLPSTVLSVVLPSRDKVEAVQLLVKTFGWKKLSTVSTSNPLAISELNMFSEFRTEKNKCVLSSTLFESDSNEFKFSPKMHSNVLFTADDVLAIEGQNSTSEHFFIHIPGATIDRGRKKYNFTQNVIFVQENFPELEELAEYVMSDVYGKRNMVADTFRNYFRIIANCTLQSNDLNACNNPSEVKGNLIASLSSRRQYALASGFSSLHTAARTADRNCLGFIPTDCTSVLPSLHGNSVGMTNTLNFLGIRSFFHQSKGVMFSTGVDVSFLVVNRNQGLVKVGVYADRQITGVDPTEWQEIVDRFTEPPCLHRCETCWECPSKVMVKEGDFYIRALLPVHSDSMENGKCGEWNRGGLMATEALQYAISSLKSRHTNILENFDLGYVILDSCYVRNEPEDVISQCIPQRNTTSYDWSNTTTDRYNNVILYDNSVASTDDNINTTRNEWSNTTTEDDDRNTTSKGKRNTTTHDGYIADIIISSVEYINNMESFNIRNEAHNTDMFITDFGMYSSKISLTYFSDALIAILRQLHWSGINIIYSNSQFFSNAFLTVQRRLKSTEMCVLGVFKFPSHSVSSADIMSSMRGIARRSKVAILLTDMHDTKALLNAVYEHDISIFSNIIIPPWNDGVLQEYGDRPILGSLVMEATRIQTSSLQEYLGSLSPSDTSYNPWWGEHHEDYKHCHFNGNGEKYKYACIDRPTFMDTEVPAGIDNILRSIDLIALSLDAVYKELCDNQVGPCEALHNTTDVKMRMRKNIFDTDEAYSSGIERLGSNEIAVPITLTNTKLVGGKALAVAVGTYSPSVGLNLNPAHVKSYIGHAEEYDATTSCGGWCPECNACHATSPLDVDHLFIPGDVVIAGLFPIHSEGRRPYTCGALTISQNTELFIEAFLYAVESVKTTDFHQRLANFSIGALVFDTCSNPLMTGLTVSNFETCSASFGNNDNSENPNPYTVKSYLSYGFSSASPFQKQLLGISHKKIAFSIDEDFASDEFNRLNSNANDSEVRGIADILQQQSWTFVSVVASNNTYRRKMAELFFSEAKRSNICIERSAVIDSNDETTMKTALAALSKSTARVVVVFCDIGDIRQLFRVYTSYSVSLTWVFASVDTQWSLVQDIALPLGSVLLDRMENLNEEFEKHFLSKIESKARGGNTGNPWIEPFRQARENCQAEQNNQAGNLECTNGDRSSVLLTLSRIVESVHLLIRAIDNLYLRECKDQNGLCEKFGTAQFYDKENELSNISFSNAVSLTEPGEPIEVVYHVYNYQKTVNLIGTWTNGNLNLTKSFKSYSSNGNELSVLRVSQCFTNCVCLNLGEHGQQTNGSKEKQQTRDPSLMFYNSSGEFMGEVWSIVVVTVAGGGSIVALGILIYVSYKICRGILHKHYVGLGLSLLFGIILLYLSTLPFLFTPSYRICALQYFMPGLAYAFCFGVLIVKLMSLRSYKLLGLGGEISVMNQFLTVLFIVGVQIAIHVQWWAMSEQMCVVIKEAEVTQYACKFDKQEFIMLLAYVMFLVLLSAVYSVWVRKERNNLGEARLILIFNWMCVIIWAVWVFVLMMQPRDFSEPSICIGMLVCATLLIFVIFIPKLQTVATLKYQISTKTRDENGMKADADFMFERPWSVPTLRGSYNENIAQRNSTTFDSSLSY
ncbi:hypothetical protein ScPMuIL_008826 [Solemya velum]